MMHSVAKGAHARGLSAVLISGLLGTGAVLDVSAAPVADGLHCGPRQTLLGGGRRTTTEMIGCVQASNGRTDVVVHTATTGYRSFDGELGYIWYSAGPGNQSAIWSGYGSVRQGAWSGDFTTPVRTQVRSSDKAVAPETMNLQCGNLFMELKIVMAGPYWRDPKDDIDPPRSTFEISLPCS